MGETPYWITDSILCNKYTVRKKVGETPSFWVFERVIPPDRLHFYSAGEANEERRLSKKGTRIIAQFSDCSKAFEVVNQLNEDMVQAEKLINEMRVSALKRARAASEKMTP